MTCASHAITLFCCAHRELDHTPRGPAASGRYVRAPAWGKVTGICTDSPRFRRPVDGAPLSRAPLHRRMAHRLGVGPGAVHTREVAGPEEVPYTHLRHTPKPASSSTSNVKKTCHFTNSVGCPTAGCRAERPGRGTAPIVLPVEAPEQERHPPHPRLFKDKAHPRMAIVDASEDNGAQQFRHRPHREVDHPHQGLVPRLQAGDPYAIWRIPVPGSHAS